MENEKEMAFEEVEFENWCDANDLEKDVSVMKEDLAEAFIDLKKRFIKAMKQQRLVVKGQELEYTVSKFSPDGFSGEVLTIKAPRGNAFIGTSDDSAKKTMAFMSAMTGKDIGYFGKLDIRDYLFLAGVVGAFLL
ncbi:MAG: hypothetical protein IKT97_07700 [Spirochaetia bacterium]|nr:hypothetical protein [Spirochaetia bacterium]